MLALSAVNHHIPGSITLLFHRLSRSSIPCASIPPVTFCASTKQPHVLVCLLPQGSITLALCNFCHVRSISLNKWSDCLAELLSEAHDATIGPQRWQERGRGDRFKRPRALPACHRPAARALPRLEAVKEPRKLDRARKPLAASFSCGLQVPGATGVRDNRRVLCLPRAPYRAGQSCPRRRCRRLPVRCRRPILRPPFALAGMQRPPGVQHAGSTADPGQPT